MGLRELILFRKLNSGRAMPPEDYNITIKKQDWL